MNKSLVISGSLSNIAERNRISIAEAFIDVDACIIVDVSSSMEAHDSRDGQSRWQVAGQELINLQRTMPGKLAVIAFSDRSEFVPSGILPEIGRLGNMTNLAGALKFAKVLDVEGIRFVIISDGLPDNSYRCFGIAATYKNRIDTIYVGPEGGGGSNFLERLAGESGGQGVTADRAKMLAMAAQKLLLTTG